MTERVAGTSDIAPPISALSPLRFPVFRNVLFASLSSNVGGLIQSVGASWLMISIGHSAHMVALVQSSTALPFMLFSLLAGAMADSFDRRKIMLGAQTFMLITSATLAVCAWSGVITPWLLLLFTFLIGCGTVFNGPAWQASVGDMVPRAELPLAVTLNGMGFNIARTVGPAVGGAIVAAAGVAAAFAVNAVSYIALIVVLARWRPPSTSNLLPRERLGTAIATGIRYVSMSPTIRRVLMRGILFGLGSSAVMALLPLVARMRLGGGPLTYGLLLGGFGIGAVLGALSNAQLRSRMTTESIVTWSSLSFAAAAVTVGLSTQIVLILPALLIAGGAWVLALSTFNVSVQLSTPRWVVARALSLYQMAVFGAIAAGGWIWGGIAERDNVTVSLLSAAAVMLICGLYGRWQPLSQIADLNLDPFRSFKAPATEVPVEARTGPVVVAIDYLIREDDILEFLRVMSERRRIRRRDGAHNWMLLRDLSNPQLWVERYMTPTWLDYIRHNNRMTHDDASVLQRLHALHQGPGEPSIRRMIERQTDSLPVGHGSSAHDFAEPLTDATRSS